MKNIFKKTLKFISSRLLYLVVGIFLAIGATYVYATWDSARTGGSGQLTEANWNELVTMIQSNIGVTSAPSSWACVVRSGTRAQYSTATCVGSEKAISGGCDGGESVSANAVSASYPFGQGWKCTMGGSGQGTAYANCCQ